MGAFDILKAKGYHLYNPSDQGVSTWSIPLGSGALGAWLGPKSDYMLEIWTPTSDGAPELHRAIIFPYVDSIEILRPAPTKTTFGFGVAPIREHSVNRNLTIRMTGTSGLANRSGHDRYGDTVSKDGPFLLREFDAFLDYFQSKAVLQGSSYQDPTIFSKQSYTGVYMVFRSFSEQIHVRVEPRTWTVRRATKNARFSYLWDLDMQAYAPATPQKAPALFGGHVVNAMQFVTECVDSCANVMGMVGNAIESVNQVLSTVKGPLQALGNVSGQFARSVQGVQSILSLPRAAAAYLAQAGSRAEGAVVALAQQYAAGFLSSPSPPGGDRSSKIERDILNMLADVADTARLATTVAGLSGLTKNSGYIFPVPTGKAEIQAENSNTQQGLSPADPSGDPMENAAVPGEDPEPIPADDPPIGFAATVAEGDTVESLAKKYLGSSTLWWAIVGVNKMPMPATKADGTVLRAGDTLIIPQRSAVLTEAKLSPGQDMVADKFGKDLYLDAKTGDLQVLGSDALDIRTVNDKQNLEQGIRNRLLTHQGESSYWPGYGLPIFIGGKVTGELIGYAAAHINEQLLRDPRVVSLSELTLQDEGDTISAFIGVHPIVGSNVSVVTRL
jgi:hypothetical protein